MASILKVDEIKNPSTNVTVINTSISQEIDCWMVSTSYVSNSGSVLSPWARNNHQFDDGTPIGKFPIGTGLTYDSGTASFSFPVTGVYQIDLTISFSSNLNNDNTQWRFQVSKDNGSNYTDYGTLRISTSQVVGLSFNTQTTRKTGTATFFIDVNSVTGSNATKFRIQAHGQQAAQVVNGINQKISTVYGCTTSNALSTSAMQSNFLCQRIGNSPVAS